jgi:peptide/nickel transport system substrate-binding protein
LPAVACLALLTLAAGGCRDGSPWREPVAAGTVAPTPTPDPNTLVWAVAAPPTTLDPAHLAIDPAGTQIAAQIYDRLVQYRPGTAELAPGVASTWDASAKENTFTFTLREGLRFHDGTPLDAVAVVWNFQRWMDPGHPAHQGDFPGWKGYFGGFVGEKDGEQDRNLIRSVEALDARTVRFTLNRPFTPFLHHLALVPFGLASPTAVAAQGEQYGADGAHLPVGSGPYRAVGWSEDGTIRLVRTDDYWGGSAATPSLAFVPIADEAARAAALAAGAVHGTELAQLTPITGSLSAATVRLVPRPSRSTAWLMLNHARTPLDDVRVRRAISLAIDRERLAREHFGSQAVPANQLLPPDLVGFNAALPPLEHNPDAARALLAEVGVAQGFPLVIWVPNSPRGYLPDPAGTAGALAEMLNAIGIQASVRSRSLRQFLIDRDNGRFTAWVAGWEAQSGDPDNFWFWHFGTPRIAAEGQYQNPGLAASLIEAQRTIGPEQRLALYHAAAQTVADDVARVFLVHPRLPIAISTRLGHYEPGPMGLEDLSGVTLLPPPAGAAPMAIPTGDVPLATPAETVPAAGTAATPGTPEPTLAASPPAPTAGP